MASPGAEGSGAPMKYPVTHSTTMASAITQCQMRTGASQTYLGNLRSLPSIDMWVS